MAKTQRGGPSGPHDPAITPEVALKRLERLLARIPAVLSAGPESAALATWEGDVKIVLGEFYGEDSIPFREFKKIWFIPPYGGQPRSEIVGAFSSGLDQARGFLESRVHDLSDRLSQAEPSSSLPSFTPKPTSRKVFVVHGTEHGKKETVARFLEKLKLKPIILHEQPDHGRTIIEKFESHSEDVRCAVVLLTADDVGGPKSDPVPKELRARQNVIFELGFFIGKLGRQHTIALLEKGVELPSDFKSIIYIKLDDPAWRLLLVRELNAAGLKVDANLAL